MKKIRFIAISIFGLFSLCFAAEESITITTYYPSPYGSYNSLQTDKLGVGDNNGDGNLTSVDVPTTPGDARISGKVGIGTAPRNKLDVEGGAVIGSSYAGTSNAPTNGMLVQGNVGVGTVAPAHNLDVNGSMRANSISLGGVTKSAWPLGTVTGYYVDTSYGTSSAKLSNLGVHTFCFLTGVVFQTRDNTDHDRNDLGQCYVYRSPDNSTGSWYLETYCDGDGESSAFQRCYARCVDI